MLRNLGREPKGIGKRVALAREALGMDQTEFARGVGKRQSACSGWETGLRPPGLPIAHKLCDRYGLTLDYIYRGITAGLAGDLEDRLRRLKQRG